MDLSACLEHEQSLERAETEQQDSQSSCHTASGGEQAQPIIAEITPVAIDNGEDKERSGVVSTDECMTSLPQLCVNSDVLLGLEKSCSQTESATTSTNAIKDATEGTAEGQTDIAVDEALESAAIATSSKPADEHTNECINILEGTFKDINETVVELDQIGEDSDFVPDSQPPIHGKTIGFSSSPPREAETSPQPHRGDAVHSSDNELHATSRPQENTEASVHTPSGGTYTANDVQETSLNIECQHDLESATVDVAGLSKAEIQQNHSLIDSIHNVEPALLMLREQDDLLEDHHRPEESTSLCRTEVEAVRTIVDVSVIESHAETALDGERDGAHPDPDNCIDTGLSSELQLESSLPPATAIDSSGALTHSPAVSTDQDNASSEPRPVTSALTAHQAIYLELATSLNRAITPITTCRDDTVHSAEIEATETRQQADLILDSNNFVEAAPETRSTPDEEAEDFHATHRVSSQTEPSISKGNEQIDVVDSDSPALSEKEIPTMPTSLDQGAMATSLAATNPPSVPASPTRSDSSMSQNKSLSAQSSLHEACPNMRETPAKAKSVTLPHISTPSTVARPQKTGIPGQTYFGGMLASNKAMRPFRSPMISRKDPKVSSTSSSSVDEPGTSAPLGGKSSVASLSSSLPRNKFPSASTPSRSSPLSTQKPSLNTTSSPTRSQANPALNKPFKSLVSNLNPKSMTADAQSSSDAISMVNDEGNCVNSLWLSMALPKMERRLALLKDAKRHRQAREKKLDSADNTDHILELSAKWLEKGREAAELLWELVKDSMDSANDHSAINKDTANGNDSGNWGWDSSASEGPTAYKNRNNWGGGSTERLTQKLQEQIDALPEDARQDMYDQLEREGSLPEIDTDTGFASRSAKRESDAPSNNRSKRRRLEHEGSHKSCSSLGHSPQSDTEGNASPDIDNDALLDTTHDGPENLQDLDDNSDSKMEREDDPMQRGIAKMLTQCGIDAKTLRWDPTLEEWEQIEEDI